MAGRSSNASSGLSKFDVTIANGTSLSDAADFGLCRLGRITMPAAWTAADLTFLTSADNGQSWNELYDAAGNPYTVKAAAERAIIIPVSDMLAHGLMKVRSGTLAAPVNQAADRVITLTLVL